MIHGKPKIVELTPDKKRCWFHFSDLAYTDFGRGGYLSHWKIASIFESARYFSLKTEMLQWDLVSSVKTTDFILGTYYEMIPELWTLSRYERFPYKISVEISDLGKTSVTLYSEMVNKLSNQTLASCLCKVVHVDVATRRPLPFPPWYIQRRAVNQKRSITFTRTAPEVPMTAHCYNVKVAASDIDINEHVNQATYICFCCDAAQEALKAQALSGFQQDIARYPLLEQQVVYLGECSTGDSLQVYVWQPPDHTERVLSVIKRQDAESQSTAIFLADMTFQMKQLPQPQRYARL